MANRNLFVILTSLVLAASLVASVQGQKSKPPAGGNTLVPVTADFRCPLGQDCQSTDQIEGDLLGPYRGTTPPGSATTREGLAENMGGYFTEDHLFLFSLKSGLGRVVSLGFTNPIGIAPCAASQNCRKNFVWADTDVSLPGSRVYPVDAQGRDLPDGFMSITVGQTVPARWYFNFADPDGRSLLWTVRFDPALYPGSTFLSVTRHTTDRWSVEAGDEHIAELVSATTGAKSVKVNEGYYRMPFRITVTK